MKTIANGLAVVVCLVVVWVPVGQGASYTSTATGNYNADGTWNEGGNPGGDTPGDTVTIDSPHVVTVTADYDASNDVVTVNSGSKLTTLLGGDGKWHFGWAEIELNGGTLATDIRTWYGAQTGSKINVKADSTIDTVDTAIYGVILSAEYGSLTIIPPVNKVTFTNSQSQAARCLFTDSVTVSNSVEIAVPTDKAYVQFKNLGIPAGKVLTKTGAGTLEVTGTPTINGGIVVNGGTLQPLTAQCLGTREIAINSGTTLFVNYLNDALDNLPISLNGGRINCRYTDWARTTKGFVTIKADSTMNVYNAAATMHGPANIYDTLAFDADPAGEGYELHCTHIGSHANWTTTVLYSKFGQACTITNNAVIDTDQYAGCDFGSTLSIAAGKTLRKKGPGKLNFTGVVTSGSAGLAIEAGEVTTSQNLAFDTLTFHINDTTSGTDYGQLNIAAKNLSNPKLDLVASQWLTVGDKAVIIPRTTGTVSLNDPTGTAIAEGGEFTAGDAAQWKLSYAGGDGNDVEVELLTLPLTAFPPVITNRPAVDIGPTNASLVGYLSNTGAAPTEVVVYWGTNNGLQEASAWTTNMNLGQYPVRVLTNVVGGLTEETVYHFTFFATNSAGGSWADPSHSFRTIGRPDVNNGGGATNVAYTSARLRGEVTAGHPTPDATLYWGPTDGVTNTSAWTNVVPFGTTNGAFAVTVTVSPGSTYYYRCYASNSYMAAWADDSSTFTALAMTPYTSKASGNYNADGTWNEGGNPGGATSADMATIQSPHGVTVTAAYDASNDLIIVQSGAILTTPLGGNGELHFAWAEIDLNGGTLATDIRTWYGLQTGSKINVKANSTIDTVDSLIYGGIWSTSYGSLTITPPVNKVTFTNSQTQVARCLFSDSVTVSSSVEIAVPTDKAYVQFRDLVMTTGKVLTKTGAGTLEVIGTTTIDSNIIVDGGTLRVFSSEGLAGTQELTINNGGTLLVWDNTAGFDPDNVLQNIPVHLGGTISWGFNGYTHIPNGNITIKSNSAMNVADTYEVSTATLGPLYDTLAFDAAPLDEGYEVHFTNVGSHANKTNKVLYSRFSQACSIDNNAVLNADEYGGCDFNGALSLAAGKTLRKKGQGILRFSSTVNASTASLAIEAGMVTNATSDLAFDTLTFHINGTTLGTDYGQLNTAANDLTNTKLDVIPDEEALTLGQTFVVVTSSAGTIALKDLTGAAIAEGGSFKASDKSTWHLSYVGGGGSDVELEYVKSPPKLGTVIIFR